MKSRPDHAQRPVRHLDYRKYQERLARRKVAEILAPLSLSDQVKVLRKITRS